MFGALFENIWGEIICCFWLYIYSRFWEKDVHFYTCFNVQKFHFKWCYYSNAWEKVNTNVYCNSTLSSFGYNYHIVTSHSLTLLLLLFEGHFLNASRFEIWMPNPTKICFELRFYASFSFYPDFSFDSACQYLSGK